MVVRYHQADATVESKKTVNVFVTGFGPFPVHGGGSNDGNDGGDKTHPNTSHLITKLLPSSLPAHSAANRSSTHINILNPTAGEGAYVKTEYAYIRQYTKQLHATSQQQQQQTVDLYLHIGMANGWDHVTVERRAYKQGFSSDWWGGGSSSSSSAGTREYYTTADNAGKTARDAGACPWGADVPVGLATGVDVDAIVAGANASLSAADGVQSDGAGVEGQGKPAPPPPPLQVKPHHEAGSYCCGFIFYESLANRLVQGTRGEVMFCHVPGEFDQESLERGRDAIVAVIAAAVERLP
ncbi:hypothetical protein MBLNU459_g3261t1 [Dothideomycetes sp. NU459]